MCTQNLYFEQILSKNKNINFFHMKIVIFSAVKMLYVFVMNPLNYFRSYPVFMYLMNTEEYLSRVMRKPAFCICKNKGADQLHGQSQSQSQNLFIVGNHNRLTLAMNSY